MTQFVRVTQKGAVLRRTTEGVLYEVIRFTPEGGVDPAGHIAAADSYTIRDDAGREKTAWLQADIDKADVEPAYRLLFGGVALVE